MRLTRSSLLLFLFLSALLGSIPASLPAQRFPEKMNPPRLVNDYISLLSGQENALLEQKLLRYTDTTSTEIAVVIVSTLNGEDPNLYAAELGAAWGVGRKGKDNGLVFLVAKEDRKMAIQNGYGLEEKLTDLETKQIIEDYVIPAFKKDAYYTGIDRGTDQIFKLLNGTFEGKPNRKRTKKPAQFLPFLLIVILLVVFMSRRGGRGRGGYRGGGGYWIGGFGGSGSSGGFGGGGGFGGFGGGSFGGGGASGSW